MKKQWHQKIGKIKSIIFDQWPYAVVVSKIPEMREDLAKLVHEIPRINSSGFAKYELHMLCGKRDLSMGIFASWSIMRYMEGHAKLLVHSDGSLEESDLELWKNCVGDLELVSREVADQKAKDQLGNLKQLHRWRCTNWASSQLVDSHLFGTNSSVLLIDSDVLIFDRPIEVLEAMEMCPPCFRWCRDLLDAYSGPPELLEEITGCCMPERLCAGFMVAPRLSLEDFCELDMQLEKIKIDGRLSINHFWSCQTYFGILSGRFPNSAPFSYNYDNSVGRTKSDQIMRHYVGVPRIRYRYFKEGIPRLMTKMEAT